MNTHAHRALQRARVFPPHKVIPSRSAEALSDDPVGALLPHLPLKPLEVELGQQREHHSVLRRGAARNGSSQGKSLTGELHHEHRRGRTTVKMAGKMDGNCD